MKHIFLCTIFLLLTGLFLSDPASCDDVKARMTARLPTITSLKAGGIIGENNKGFLDFRTSQHNQADVVEAENKDRLEIYQEIATRQKASVDFVGKTRAAQIAEKEPAGFWIQKPDGNWVKK